MMNSLFEGADGIAEVPALQAFPHTCVSHCTGSARQLGADLHSTRPAPVGPGGDPTHPLLGAARAASDHPPQLTHLLSFFSLCKLHAFSYTVS
jgi:hypothetical protein